MLLLGQLLISLIILALFVIGNITTIIYLLKYWPKFSAFTTIAALLEAIINGKTGFYAHAGAHHSCPWIMSTPKGWNLIDNLIWAWAHPSLYFFSIFALMYSLLSTVFSIRAAVVLLSTKRKELTMARLFIV